MEAKKTFQKFIVCFVTSTLIVMILLGGFVILMDPLYHYHAPFWNIPIILDNAVYQTAGAAKNLEYDSAIVGTSMTENMHTSWFDEELGWNTMKLSYAGARSSDLEAIFEQISQREGELKYLVTDINAYQLTSPSWTAYVERPYYLYDNQWCNDYKYLLNHDVMVTSVKRWMDGLKGVADNIDSAYTWEDPELFGKDITLSVTRDTRWQLINNRPIDDSLYKVPGSISEQLEERIQTCQENLDNILPFIEAHPETEFWIIIPPYSMLYWEQEILKGSLEDMLAVYEYAIGSFLKYDNVKVFYFQNEQDIITNLDNFRDAAHHTPEINRYIFECMVEDKNRLTKDNYKQELEEMYNFAKNYPYETIWEE